MTQAQTPPAAAAAAPAAAMGFALGIVRNIDDTGLNIASCRTW
jgi:hypothetical protein